MLGLFRSRANCPWGKLRLASEIRLPNVTCAATTWAAAQRIWVTHTPTSALYLVHNQLISVTLDFVSYEDAAKIIGGAMLLKR